MDLNTHILTFTMKSEMVWTVNLIGRRGIKLATNFIIYKEFLTFFSLFF